METVAPLYPTVRPEASYDRSLEVLRYVKEKDPSILTKTGIMLGLGETKEQVLQTMDDVLSTGCDIFTIGQYLRPSPAHVEMKEYISPEIFAQYKEIGLQKGFRYVASSPPGPQFLPRCGGTIYTDLGGWQFTFIIPGKTGEISFHEYISPVIDALHDMGIPGASFHGRNDLVIDGKKFSGNAQYLYNGFTLHHGRPLQDHFQGYQKCPGTRDQYFRAFTFSHGQPGI